MHNHDFLRVLIFIFQQQQPSIRSLFFAITIYISKHHKNIYIKIQILHILALLDRNLGKWAQAIKNPHGDKLRSSPIYQKKMHCPQWINNKITRDGIIVKPLVLGVWKIFRGLTRFGLNKNDSTGSGYSNQWHYHKQN